MAKKPVKWDDFVNECRRFLEKHIPGIITPRSKYQLLFQKVNSHIKEKVIIINDPPPPEPKHVGYVIIPKSDYDSWRDKDGLPKKGLKSWQYKIAIQDWGEARKSNDGTKAIFRVEYNEDEKKEFMKFTEKRTDTDSSFEREDPENEKDGKEELKKYLNTSQEWETKEDHTAKPPTKKGNVKRRKTNIGE